MPAFLVTYDATGGQSEILQAALELGFTFLVTNKSGQLCRLPNTTLWGDFHSVGNASVAFKAAVTRAKRRSDENFIVTKTYILPKGTGEIKSDETGRIYDEWKHKRNIDTCRYHQMHAPEWQ